MKKVARNFVSPRLGLVVIAFALIATSGFTCAKVSDPLGDSSGNTLAPGGGVGFGNPFPEHLEGLAACIGQCSADAKASRSAERQLHRANLASCGSDANCIAAENARFTARMAEINQIEQDCITECHNQGGGVGGE